MSMEIGAYSGILQNYRVPTIPAVNADPVGERATKDLEKQQSQQDQISANTYEKAAEIAAVTGKKDAPIEDISITFNKQEDFGYIGKDSDILSLDVERAISDMQKDKVLRQYQYFVGESRNLYMQQGSPDGIVIPKY